MDNFDQELRDRLTRVETRQETMKENFTAFAAEIKAEYKKLSDGIDTLKTQQIKIIVIVTLLAQAGGQAIGPIAKMFLGG